MRSKDQTVVASKGQAIRFPRRVSAKGILGLFMLILAILPASLSAQSTFGTVLGRTMDQSGAALAGAQVTLHSLDENTDAVDDKQGRRNFRIRKSQTGPLRHQGDQGGVLHRDREPTGIDGPPNLPPGCHVLSVATQAQTVEVEAAAVAVNTENATLSDSKDNADITQLPLNSRSVSSSPLAALATSASVTTDAQGNIAVGGATAAQVGFSVDGISTANVRLNGALADAYPSMENIAEMKVTAFNNNAEFAQIGDVTFVTKSGTNQFHGSAFEYFQDSALDANVLNFTTKAPRTFNTFGASLGGPVTIPKLYNGKDKTFFFAGL